VKKFTKLLAQSGYILPGDKYACDYRFLEFHQPTFSPVKILPKQYNYVDLVVLRKKHFFSSELQAFKRQHLHFAPCSLTTKRKIEHILMSFSKLRDAFQEV